MPKDKKMDCQDCVFLLHYEFDGKRIELPRCSIEFRDGSKVKHPCQDKKVSQYLVGEKQGVLI